MIGGKEKGDDGLIDKKADKRIEGEKGGGDGVMNRWKDKESKGGG